MFGDLADIPKKDSIGNFNKEDKEKILEKINYKPE